MFKYLKIFSKNFSKKRPSYISVFDKWKSKEKYDNKNTNATEPQNIKKDELQYQTDKGLFDKVEQNTSKSSLPDDINYDKDFLVDEGLFVEVTKEIREQVAAKGAIYEGTNIGYLVERLGSGVGEMKKDYVEIINRLDLEKDIIPKLNTLSEHGFKDNQIKVLLHKE
jgi:hypothetical protein